MNLHEKSIEIIKKNQEKTGSFKACPNFPSYRYCWIRDGTFIAYALDVVGEPERAERFHSWVNDTVNRYSYKVSGVIEKNRKNKVTHSYEHLHCRFNHDGTESKAPWPNFQLDSYGEWLWGLAQHVKITGNENLIDRYSESISTLIEYLLVFWQEPCSDCWEEYRMKIHTSTIAAVYGGLNEINQYLKNGNIGKKLKTMKDFLIKNCTKDKAFVKYVGSGSVDSSLVRLSTPFGVFKPNDPLMKNTIRKIEKDLVNGGCRRYIGDTYYGGEWILTTGFLGWHYSDISKEKARRCLRWIENQADGKFLLPEQVDIKDWIYYRIWKRKWGGIPKPLLWSHAMYLILENELKK